MQVLLQSYNGPAINNTPLGEFYSTKAWTISKAELISDTLPIGSDAVIELRKNSYSSGNILAVTLSITTWQSADRGKFYSSTTSFSSSSISANDWLVAVPTSVWSTTPVQNLRLILTIV